MKNHNYKSKIEWTGNSGESTKNYRSYERSYTISVDGKAEIYGSSDTAFLGNPELYNPEDLLLASVSSCHLLWYLHFLFCEQDSCFRICRFCRRNNDRK